MLFWLGAIAIGLTATLFITASEIIDREFARFAQRYPYAPLVITPIGLTIIAWLSRRYFPGTEGSGIPQTIASLSFQAKQGLLGVRIILGKIALTLSALACGASIGLGGPMVQISASLMFVIISLSKPIPRNLERGIILAGGGAGIAAVFSTPIAGVVFAMEELGRSMKRRHVLITLVAVVIASATTMFLLGPVSYFDKLPAGLETMQAWAAVPICGVMGGLMGGGFSRVILSSGPALQRIARRHPYLFTLSCGLIIAICGIATTTVIYGTGHLPAQAILDQPGSEPDLLYPFTKMLASAAAFVSGVPAGIFAPSISIGAGLGADLGHWFPVASMSSMILLGMVAYFSGVTQAPITAFIIVLEMTRNYDMALAAIATSLVATGTSRLLCPQPLYQDLAMAFMRVGRGPVNGKPAKA